jgi:GNAT superfamily N-acetyltransferase
MITCAVESFSQSIDELKKVIPMHYEELALNKDKVPLSPQWDIYKRRDAMGEVLFVVMREAGEMIGYFIGFIAPGLHYSTCLTCTMDIFYIRPDKRGSGLPGIRLFKAVEEELKRRGVKRWFVGSKTKADASALFERLKFDRVEVYYSKWIGG